MFVGCAKIEITPEIGSLMACFPLSRENPRRSEGIHDPLYARAIVIDDGENAICLCSCDLAMIHGNDVKSIRRKVGTQIPELSNAKCTIAVTHTHSAGENSYLFGNTPDDPWIEELRNKIAEIIIEAYEGRIPVKVSYAKMEFEENFNRRILDDEGNSVMKMEYVEGVTEGETDPELNIIKFEKQNGDILGVLINYTAHALTVGPGNMMYTADYPGVVCDFLEKKFQGSTALFFNGAAGNIHPKQCMRKEFQIMSRFGRSLGENVSILLDNVNFLDNSEIKTVSDNLTFPNRVDSKLSVSVELVCHQVGQILFAIVPGEYFVEFQLRYKERFSGYPVIFIGYANSWPGYIPTLESYDEGGYGVDLDTNDPPECSRTALPPGAGEKILDTFIRLTEELV